MLSCFSHVQLFVTLWTVALPGSSVHRILQARILEWVAMPSSRGSYVQSKSLMSLTSPALSDRFSTTSAIREVHVILIATIKQSHTKNPNRMPCTNQVINLVWKVQNMSTRKQTKQVKAQGAEGLNLNIRKDWFQDRKPSVTQRKTLGNDKGCSSQWKFTPKWLYLRPWRKPLALSQNTMQPILT